MRFLVGLGNPGERYRRTRHNAGFMVLDALATRAGAPRGHVEDEIWTAETTVADERVLLAKPLAFMNRSGAPVARLLSRRGGSPSDVVVVEDDIVLELGTLRVRGRGGHGGHNGLRSLIEFLDSDEFPRVRVGIRKGEPPLDLAGYVLSEFPEEDVLVVQEVVGWAADAVECVLREGTAAAMNRYNGLRRA